MSNKTVVSFVILGLAVSLIGFGIFGTSWIEFATSGVSKGASQASDSASQIGQNIGNGIQEVWEWIVKYILTTLFLTAIVSIMVAFLYRFKNKYSDEGCFWMAIVIGVFSIVAMITMGVCSYSIVEVFVIFTIIGIASIFLGRWFEQNVLERIF